MTLTITAEVTVNQGEVQYCKFTAGDCQGYAADHGGQGQE